MLALIGSIISAAATLFSWVARRSQKSQADKVAATDHAMLQDAVNRPDRSSVAGDMKRGDF